MTDRRFPAGVQISRRTVTAGMASAAATLAAPAVFAQAKFKLDYWVDAPSKGPAEKIAAQFMKDNPRYEISIQGIPFAVMWEKVQAGLIGGKSAELISVVLTWIPALAEAGHMHPISRQWATDLSAAEREDYVPLGIKLATFRDNLYGLPYRVDGNIMLWSADAFREAGMDPTKGPETLDDLVSYSARLTRQGQADRQFGLAFAAKPLDLLCGWFFYPVLWDMGGDVTDEKVGTSRLDEKAARDAIAYVIDLNRTHRCVAPDAFNYAWSDLSPIIAKRNAAIVMGHQANIEAILKVTPGFNLAAGPYPGGAAGRFTNGSGWCNMIPKTADLDMVWPFLKYLQQPMHQAEITIGAPGARSGLAHPKFDWLRNNPLLKYAVTSGTDTARVHPLSTSPKRLQINRVIGNVLSDAWLGKMTTAQAADDIHKAVNEVLKTT
jgi:multiple sugar transport system substrate-binding protein